MSFDFQCTFFVFERIILLRQFHLFNCSFTVVDNKLKTLVQDTVLTFTFKSVKRKRERREQASERYRKSKDTEYSVQNRVNENLATSQCPNEGESV